MCATFLAQQIVLFSMARPGEDIWEWVGGPSTTFSNHTLQHLKLDRSGSWPSQIQTDLSTCHALYGYLTSLLNNVIAFSFNLVFKSLNQQSTKKEQNFTHVDDCLYQSNNKMQWTRYIQFSISEVFYREDFSGGLAVKQKIYRKCPLWWSCCLRREESCIHSSWSLGLDKPVYCLP